MFLISIIIPAYNRAGLIERCVSSVVAQTHGLWELIVVDDGSTDNTKEVIHDFADPRIRYIYQSNAGAAAARNTGAQHATGNYIVFLDSDDEADPEWLFEFANACGNTRDVVTAGFKRYNASGNLIEERIAADGHALQQRYGIFLAGTYLIRRDLFLRLGSFDTALLSGHHTDLAIRIIQMIDRKEISAVRIEKTLVRIYDHTGQKIRSNWNSVYQGSLLILQKHFAYMKASDLPWLESYYVVLARAAHALKFKRLAVHYGWKVVRTKPRSLRNWVRLMRYLFF
jgi:glycosyltransferase involved in cell wall biosynthesis